MNSNETLFLKVSTIRCVELQLELDQKRYFWSTHASIFWKPPLHFLFNSFPILTLRLYVHTYSFMVSRKLSKQFLFFTTECKSLSPSCGFDAYLWNCVFVMLKMLNGLWLLQFHTYGNNRCTYIQCFELNLMMPRKKSKQVFILKFSIPYRSTKGKFEVVRLHA